MKIKRFRPHHIFCLRFIRLGFPERGEEYHQVEKKIINILQKEEDALLEMNEGVDELCRACTNCQDDRCQSPNGNEEAVRKWDNIILKGLGIYYGETRTSKQWRNLIEQEGPLEFCQTRCPQKLNCAIFSILHVSTEE